jgi:ABC-type polysaccharide/polyol phosphate export permease
VAALAVLFVDVIDLYQFGLTVLMYLTPIFYPSSIIPERYAPWFALNPIYYFVEIFRAPIFQGTLPEGYVLARAALIALAALVGGWWFFTRKSDEFAYRT